MVGKLLAALTIGQGNKKPNSPASSRWGGAPLVKGTFVDRPHRKGDLFEVGNGELFAHGQSAVVIDTRLPVRTHDFMGYIVPIFDKAALLKP
jgi:hypothetical protein